MCKIARILINGPLLINNLLEFHSHKQPNLVITIHIIQQRMLFCKLHVETSCCFKFQSGHFFAPNNSVEHWMSHTEMHFLGWLKSYRNFFSENRVVEPLYRNTNVICCLCFFGLLLLLCCCLPTKRLHAYVHDFTAEQSHLWYVWLILLQKCLG